MEPKDKIFVTGGTGFIGSRLVEELVRRGHQVRALSRQTKPEPPPGFGWTDGGPLAQAQVELVRGDITDAQSVLRGMEGCAYVFHLAAYAKNWARDPSTFFEINVQGMRNVFDAVKRLGVKRVVWTSSIVTLGWTRPGEVGNEDMPRITDRYFHEYEETKTIAEKEAVRAAEDGFPVVVVNPTRVYGPGRLTEGNAVSRLIDLYDRGKAPFLLNRGVNVGNYVLVDDVVQGLIMALEKGRIGQRYILGGENATLKRFFQVIDEVSGKRHFQLPLFRLMPLLFAHFQQKRAQWFNIYPEITPAWVRSFLVDMAFSSEKAQRELGYRPTPLVEGIRITYEWLQRVRKEQA